MPTILHLDRDAFFASVEQRDFPELRGKPVVVGGDRLGKRGVVSACSYEARKFGVRSAMPAAEAKRLCPEAVFRPVRMGRYIEVSRQVMGILERFSPLVEKASVDEAYMDITGTEGLFGSARELALRIKQEIREETGLACSIGIAPVKFLAKISSDWDKPDGLFILEPEQVEEFLRVLPVKEIPGVGKKSLPQLKELGVETCEDVLQYSQAFWARRGKWGAFLYDRARGRGSAELVPHYEAKSESAENTFSKDTRDPEVLQQWLLIQAERVGASLRRDSIRGRTVTLKVKYADFTSITRSKTLREAVNSSQVIFETAVDLLQGVSLQKRVRLIGVGVSNFERGQVQLSLLTDVPGQEESERVRKEKLDSAVDAVRDKYGKDTLVRGRVFGFRKHRERDTKE